MYGNEFVTEAVDKALSKIYEGRRLQGIKIAGEKSYIEGVARFVLGREPTPSDLARFQGLQKSAGIWYKNATSPLAEKKWAMKVRAAFKSGKWFNKYMAWVEGRGYAPARAGISEVERYAPQRAYAPIMIE